MEVVEELGYAPNKTAVSLKTGQTNLLALVVPSIRNVYYPKLARYVQNYASEKGYMMLLCSTDYKVEKEKRISGASIQSERKRGNRYNLFR